MTDLKKRDRLDELWDATPGLNRQLARAKDEQLLAAIDDLLRVAPTLGEFSADRGSDRHLGWLGRASAVFDDPVDRSTVRLALNDVPSEYLDPCRKALSTLKILLQKRRAQLAMALGRGAIVVGEGQVFEYFDELRRVIETARSDVFFVDACLDADLVARYLPYVADGCAIRLLGGPKKVRTLLPAVDLFARQHGRTISVRISDNVHDRSCYLSGASFKDGAKNAPVVITQITDASQAMLETERLWASGRV